MLWLCAGVQHKFLGFAYFEWLIFFFRFGFWADFVASVDSVCFSVAAVVPNVVIPMQ
jgi:hypothetical protein